MGWVGYLGCGYRVVGYRVVGYQAMQYQAIQYQAIQYQAIPHQAIPTLATTHPGHHPPRTPHPWTPPSDSRGLMTDKPGCRFRGVSVFPDVGFQVSRCQCVPVSVFVRFPRGLERVLDCFTGFRLFYWSQGCTKQCFPGRLSRVWDTIAKTRYLV